MSPCTKAKPSLRGASKSRFLLIIALGVCAIVMAAVLRHWIGVSNNDITVTIISCRYISNLVNIRVHIKNESNQSLWYEGDPMNCHVEYLSDGVWKTAGIYYRSPSSFGTVEPGETFAYDMKIREKVRRVRVTCSFETPGMQIVLGQYIEKYGRSPIVEELRQFLRARHHLWIRSINDVMCLGETQDLTP